MKIKFGKKTMFASALTASMFFSVPSQSQISKSEREALKKEIKAELKQEQNDNAGKNLINKIDEVLDGRVKFSGKGLLRLYEQDFDQKTINGKLGDRYWSRYNFYLNVDVKLTKNFKLHSRLRTGHKQYSFVSFGGQTQERFGIMLDQFYLDAKKGNMWARIGRQSVGNIWKNQKGAQFDIPTHDGISAGINLKAGDISIKPVLAYFDEKYAGNTGLNKHGKIYGGSITASSSDENIAWKAQVGMINADHLPNRYQNFASDISDGSGPKYHDGDLAEQYAIVSSHLSINFKNIENLTFSGDYYSNIKDYKNDLSAMQSHLITVNPTEFADQTNGYIATVSVGGMSKPKDWYAAASYLHMEKYAAMDYFAQYDYARWASTNIKGPELKVGYRINKYMKTQARFFLTEEIKGLNASDPNFTRSGNRFRLDLNFNF